MLGTVAKRLFGSANDRFIKSLGKTVDAINALEPELEGLSDAELRARTDRLRARLDEGAEPRRPAGRRVRHRARGVQAHPGPAPFRRAADGRHRAPSGQDRRDEDRRGQDPGGDPRGLSQRARGQGRARGHGQRLSGPARRRLDGPDLPVPRADASAASCPGWTMPRASRPTPPTSPTAPTTSSASTTCATT